MGEAVLVADDVARRPPGRHVRVVRLGDQDPGEALLGAGRPGVVELQLVEPLEVEGERAQRAVDLDPQAVLAAGGEAGGLVRGDRAAVQPGQEQRGVVDRDRPRWARHRCPTADALSPLELGRQRPLRDERLGQRADPGDALAGDVLGQVDDVRADVAQRARAGHLPLQPPHQRELRVDDPVLQVDGADVPDRAEPAGGDELGHERHRRHPPVVEAAHRPRPRPPGRPAAAAIASASATVLASGFSHSTCLPAASAAMRDLGVAVARRADVDQVDVVPGDQRRASR